MKAWQVAELGEPQDVLKWNDVPDLQPGAGQVKVKVEAAALNFPDVLLCQGKYQISPTLPFTPGVEISGEIVEVGEGVQDLKVGDHVFGGPYSETGGGGGYAEYALMNAAEVFTAPEGMPAEEAAGYLLTYQTSWVALHIRTQIKAGDYVLVHAGAGGVGSATIQLAKAAGATVIATAGGPEKKQVCLDLGADFAVDYNNEDFVSVVKEVTGGHGADIIYDPVGGDVFDKSTKCVAFEGRILIIGFTSGRMAESKTNHVLVKNYSVVGVHWGYYRKMRPEVIPEANEALAKLYTDGKIKPYVSKTYPMSELPEALVALASRKTTGKVVVLP